MNLIELTDDMNLQPVVGLFIFNIHTSYKIPEVVMNK